VGEDVHALVFLAPYFKTFTKDSMFVCIASINIRSQCTHPMVKSPLPRYEGTIVSIEDLKAALEWVKSLGPVPQISRGPHSVGTTLETLLGHDLDSLPLRDFPECELKAQRKNAGSMVTLFTKTPTWNKEKGWSARKVLQTFGYEDDKGHKKAMRINLYDVEFHGMVLIPTHNGIAVTVADTGEIIGEWYTETFKEKFESKVDNIVYVNAQVHVENGIEHFHYTSAEHCEVKPDLDAKDIFDEISNRNIALEWRMFLCEDHEHCWNEGRRAGMVRDHGPAIRCQKSKLKKIYKIKELV
jgi:hypothetical protein